MSCHTPARREAGLQSDGRPAPHRQKRNPTSPLVGQVGWRGGLLAPLDESTDACRRLIRGQDPERFVCNPQVEKNHAEGVAGAAKMKAAV